MLSMLRDRNGYIHVYISRGNWVRNKMGNVHNVYRIYKGRMNKCISNVRGWGGAEKKSHFL